MISTRRTKYFIFSREVHLCAKLQTDNSAGDTHKLNHLLFI